MLKKTNESISYISYYEYLINNLDNSINLYKLCFYTINDNYYSYYYDYYNYFNYKYCEKLCKLCIKHIYSKNILITKEDCFNNKIYEQYFNHLYLIVNFDSEKFSINYTYNKITDDHLIDNLYFYINLTDDYQFIDLDYIIKYLLINSYEAVTHKYNIKFEKYQNEQFQFHSLYNSAYKKYDNQINIYESNLDVDYYLNLINIDNFKTCKVFDQFIKIICNVKCINKNTNYGKLLNERKQLLSSTEIDFDNIKNIWMTKYHTLVFMMSRIIFYNNFEYPVSTIIY